jgi:hypothetical protein
MNKIIFSILISLLLIGSTVSAQKQGNAEKYGKTLNLGVGVGGYAGYYHYIGHNLPVFHANYELDVARNFTLAPFISFSMYRTVYNWHDNNYYYHETIIPVGIKGTYYFDQLIKADSQWDFYGAGSMGFVIVKKYWDNGYDGDQNYYSKGSPLFLDLHVGAEYHFSSRLGGFIDLSTGVSTIGLSFK